jgi:hypothetical protein
VQRSCWRAAAIAVVVAAALASLHTMTTVRSRVADLAGRVASAPSPQPQASQGAEPQPVPSGPPALAAPRPRSPIPASEAPHAPTVDELVGTYLIDWFSDHGSEQAFPGGVPMGFTRDEHGVHLTTGSCDVLAGYVDIADGHLVVAAADAGGAPEPTTWTRTPTWCEGDVLMLDDALTTLLPTGPTIAIAGDQLTLTAGGMSLGAHRQPG